ncbi:MAG: DHHW family protein [Ruminococcus sp.]
MDENNNNPNTPNPQNDFDLDAALEEKFQQVQQDLDRLRAMNANADASRQRKVPMCRRKSLQRKRQLRKSLCRRQNQRKNRLLRILPTEDAPQFEIAEEALSETAPAANTPEDKESARERKARYKLKRQILITNRVGAVVRIFAIGSIIFGGSIFLLVGNRPTESAEENRKLATPPSFSMDALESGDYIATGYYYEDTVPGRSNFKHMISKLESYQGLQGEDKVQFYGNIAPVKKDTESEKKDNVTTTAPVASGNSAGVTTTVTTVTTEPEADPVEIGDGIVLVDKRAISIYGGSFSRGEKYAATLNEYKKQLGDKVNVYSLVAPTAVSFYLPDSYSGYTGSEPDNIDHIDENLQNVKAVTHMRHWRRIPTRTSTHAPTTTGCPGRLLCGRGVCQDSRRKLCAAVRYTKTTLSGYLGSMYTFTKSVVLQENPEDFTYYTPHNQYTQYYDTNFTNERDGKLLISLDNVEPVSWYLIFMGGDEKITHVKTDVTNKRTLVIVKDSYGNALVPYLTQSFSDIYVIDMRYFDLNAVSFMQRSVQRMFCSP